MASAYNTMDRISVESAFSWAVRNQLCVWRIVGLVSACGCTALTGSVYAFNAYANAVKKTFNLTQSQVEAIASVSNFGSNIAFPAGLMQEKVGVAWTLSLGLCLAFTFYLLLWSSQYSVSLYMNHPWLLYIYFFMAGFGAIFGYMAVLPVMVKNFAIHQRGRIIGILDSFFSIGPAFFAALYGACFINGHITDEENQDLKGFLLFNGLLFAAIYGLGIMFVRPISSEETDMSENSHLITPQESSVINQSDTGVNRSTVYGGKSDMTGWALFKDGEFHLMMWPFILCTSVQLMFLNNIPAYLKSFHRESYNTLLTVLSPMLTVLCKLILGIISDLTIETTPRVTYQLLCNSLMSVFLLLCIFYVDNILLFLFATIAVSVSNGAMWCLTPTMLGDMYGTRYFGRNWGWLLIGVALGGLGLQTLFGYFYDKSAGGERTCYGHQCFQWSFVIVLVLSIISTLLNAVLLKLSYRTRRTSRAHSP